jgi:hypothetical protein
MTFHYRQIVTPNENICSTFSSITPSTTFDSEISLIEENLHTPNVDADDEVNEVNVDEANEVNEVNKVNDVNVDDESDFGDNTDVYDDDGNDDGDESNDDEIMKKKAESKISATQLAILEKHFCEYGSSRSTLIFLKKKSICQVKL